MWHDFVRLIDVFCDVFCNICMSFYCSGSDFRNFLSLWTSRWCFSLCIDNLCNCLSSNYHDQGLALVSQMISISIHCHWSKWIKKFKKRTKTSTAWMFMSQSVKIWFEILQFLTYEEWAYVNQIVLSKAGKALKNILD